MAADILSEQQIPVCVFDAMPSVARKFLLAGKGGMNITHSEPFEQFVERYGTATPYLRPLLEAFGPVHLRDWIHQLGIQTFVGSSGKVFPTEMKAAPLLRSWLQRLRSRGVQFYPRHRWHVWSQAPQGDNLIPLRFTTPEGELEILAHTVILALGGGSWAKLGSDGIWQSGLAAMNIPVSPLRPSNCGFETTWSEHFKTQFAGSPLKSISLSFTTPDGHTCTRRGEALITEHGIEGSAVYALSGPVRETIRQTGQATIYLDLAPQKSEERLLQEIDHPRGSRSWSSHLQSRTGLKGIRLALLRECLPLEVYKDSRQLASAIKGLPITLTSPRPLDEAISSAGGIELSAINDHGMLTQYPGVFCAGEMLNWEAPTGGYLLTACFATGRTAGIGALNWLKQANHTTLT